MDGVDIMIKEEILRQLETFDEEELQAALQAANAVRKTKNEGLYFLHHFLQQDRVESEPQHFGVSIPVTNLVMNPLQMAHGGVIAWLADNAMGFASFMEKGRPGVTLDLNVRYHKSGKGKQLNAVGVVVSSGALFNSMKTEVRDETGVLVATASGTFYHRQTK